MSIEKVSTGDRSIGGGYIFLIETVGGVIRERKIGETDEVTENIETEYLEREDSEGTIAGMADKLPIKKTVSIKFKLFDLKKENLELIYDTPSTSTTQTGSTIEGEILSDVMAGYINTLANVDVSNVVIKDEATGVTTYTEGMDYNIDLKTAKIEILPDGAIVNGSNLTVDYTSQDFESLKFEPLSNCAIKYRTLIFVNEPISGKKIERTYHKCHISAEGNISLKNVTDYISVDLVVSVLKDESQIEGSQYFSMRTLPKGPGC